MSMRANVASREWRQVMLAVLRSMKQGQLQWVPARHVVLARSPENLPSQVWLRSWIESLPRQGH